MTPQPIESAPSASTARSIPHPAWDAVAPNKTEPLSKGERIARAITWPAAVILVLHRVFIVALNGTPTDDFTTVYSAIRRMLEGHLVYDQAYHHVDPLYLYNPGATMLLAPLGLLPFNSARTIFIILGAAAIVTALAILTCLVGHRLSSALWPASIVLAFSTEAVTNTLAFTNINGLLLLALVVFLWAFLRGQDLPQYMWLRWVAGITIGLAIMVKPQFAPLLFLPLIRRDWRTILAGLAVPLLSNAIAILSLDSLAGYTDKLLPYLSTTRNYANSSWPGARAYFDIPSAYYWAVWLLAAGMIGLCILGLVRFHRTNPTLWALTTTGAIFVGIFFLSSLGQQYYSMWLFPLLFTAVLPHSAMHNWPSCLASFLFLAPLSWDSALWPDFGRWMGTFSATIGWFFLIVALTATVAGWWHYGRLTPKKADE